MKTFITQNKSYISKTAILLVWLLFWQILYWIVNKQVLIPSPYSVVKTFFALCFEPSFWLTIIHSLARILAGYLFSVFLGILLAILCYRIQLLYDILSPAIHTIKATPVASFSILVLLWVKTEIVPIVISFSIPFPLKFLFSFLLYQDFPLQLFSFYHFSIVITTIFPPAVLLPVYVNCPIMFPFIFKSQPFS